MMKLRKKHAKNKGIKFILSSRDIAQIIFFIDNNQLRRIT